MERGFLKDEPAVATPQYEVKKSKGHRGVKATHVRQRSWCAFVTDVLANRDEAHKNRGTGGPFDVRQTFAPGR